MRKLPFLFLFFIFLIPILSGCWNQKELTDLAFVMAVGVDKGTNNQKYQLSLQIVIPGAFSQGQSGGGGGGPTLPAVVYKSSGNTLTEAVKKVTKVLPRQTYFAHTNLLIFSEEVAREGILDVLDVLDRVPDFRKTTQVVIAQNTSAENLISTLTQLEKLPTNKIVKTLENTEKNLGENIKVNLDDLVLHVIYKGAEPVLSGFTVSGNPKKGQTPDNLSKTEPPAVVHASDLGVLKNGQLIGWLSGNNARGVLWVLNKIKSTEVSVDWNGKKEAVVLTAIRSKSKVSASFKNGKPVIYVSVKGEGNVNEANLPIDLTDPAVIEEIDKKTAAEIKKQVVSAIKTVQKKKTDVFGFGEVIHRSYPKEWKKLKPEWGSHFAGLEVHVNVETFQRRTGIRTKPFWSDMNK